jgi:hypothetical protein
LPETLKLLVVSNSWRKIALLKTDSLPLIKWITVRLDVSETNGISFSTDGQSVWFEPHEGL